MDVCRERIHHERAFVGGERQQARTAHHRKAHAVPFGNVLPHPGSANRHRQVALLIVSIAPPVRCRAAGVAAQGPEFEPGAGPAPNVGMKAGEFRDNPTIDAAIESIVHLASLTRQRTPGQPFAAEIRVHADVDGANIAAIGALAREPVEALHVRRAPQRPRTRVAAEPRAFSRVANDRPHSMSVPESTKSRCRVPRDCAPGPVPYQRRPAPSEPSPCSGRIPRLRFASPDGGTTAEPKESRDLEAPRNRSPITPVTLDSSARPCAAAASSITERSACDTTTSMAKVSSALSGSPTSASVTV